MRLDGEDTVRRIYSPVGGFVQQRWLALKPGPHVLEVSGDPQLDPEARGRNIMFWKAISLERRPL